MSALKETVAEREAREDDEARKAGCYIDRTTGLDILVPSGITVRQGSVSDNLEAGHGTPVVMPRKVTK